jgi:hypothetical protein
MPRAETATDQNGTLHKIRRLCDLPAATCRAGIRTRGASARCLRHSQSKSDLRPPVTASSQKASIHEWPRAKPERSLRSVVVARNHWVSISLNDMLTLETTDAKLALRCRYDQHRFQKTTVTIMAVQSAGAGCARIRAEEIWQIAKQHVVAQQALPCGRAVGWRNRRQAKEIAWQPSVRHRSRRYAAPFCSAPFPTW